MPASVPGSLPSLPGGTKSQRPNLELPAPPPATKVPECLLSLHMGSLPAQGLSGDRGGPLRKLGTGFSAMLHDTRPVHHASLQAGRLVARLSVQVPPSSLPFLRHRSGPASPSCRLHRCWENRVHLGRGGCLFPRQSLVPPVWELLPVPYSLPHHHHALGHITRMAAARLLHTHNRHVFSQPHKGTRGREHATQPVNRQSGRNGGKGKVCRQRAPGVCGRVAPKGVRGQVEGKVDSVRSPGIGGPNHHHRAGVISLPPSPLVPPLFLPGMVQVCGRRKVGV